jgi:hypothetical protein
MRQDFRQRIADCSRCMPGSTVRRSGLKGRGSHHHAPLWALLSQPRPNLSAGLRTRATHAVKCAENGSSKAYYLASSAGMRLEAH